MWNYLKERLEEVMWEYASDFKTVEGAYRRRILQFLEVLAADVRFESGLIGAEMRFCTFESTLEVT